MTWMIVGASGQLARCLLDRLPRGVDAKAFSHGELDISNESQLLQVIEQIKPAVIINCAAYTQVDLAEENPQHAFAVNAFGVENLARCANHVGALVVHFSTDYVFAGDADTPYGADSPCSPNTVYGKTKLAGERLLAEVANDFVIVRTAWLFSEYGKNFLKTMLKLAKTHTAIKVVDDQMGCPTYAGDLAQFIIWLVESGQYRNQITHFAGGSALSWAGFAKVIFKQVVELGRLDCAPEVIAIASSEYAFKTPRPAYSVLATTPSPISNDWQVSLKYVLERLEE